MRTIPFGRPIIGESEKKAVQDVLEGPILVHGPRAREFEERFAAFTRAGYAVSVSSCTAAMHLYYFHLGLGPGDEVVVPAQTHTATAHAVELTGAKPVFVDAEPRTGNIDPARIEAAVTDRTRAVAWCISSGCRSIWSGSWPWPASTICGHRRLRPGHRDRVPGNPRGVDGRCGLFLLLSGQAHDDGRRGHADHEQRGDC